MENKTEAELFFAGDPPPVLYIDLILNKFMGKCIIKYEILKEFRERFRGEKVDELINSYHNVIEWIGYHWEKEERKVITNHFYESVMEYLIETSFQKLDQIENVFLIIDDISITTLRKVILYFYTNQDDWKFQKVIECVEYKLIVMIYTLLRQSDRITDLMNLGEYKETGKMVSEYAIFVCEMYEKGIIKNPLYQEEMMEEKSGKISLLDMFAHASFFLEDVHASFFFLEIIFTLLEKREKEEWNRFYKMKLNTSDLRILSDYVDNKYDEWIYKIYKSHDKEYKYEYHFMYFLNRFYIWMQKYPYPHYRLQMVDAKVKRIDDYLFFFYEKIFPEIDHPFHHFHQDEMMSICSDLHRVDYFRFYKRWIEYLDGNEFPYRLLQSHIVISHFRYIFITLNKFGKCGIAYDSEKDQYYFRFEGRNKILSYEQYIQYIKEYLKRVDMNMRNFMIKTMREFVEWDYPQMLKMEREVEDADCMICFEEVEDPKDRVMCVSCKKIYHSKCAHDMWKKRYDHCGNCRKPILFNICLYRDARLKIFRDLLNSL